VGRGWSSPVVVGDLVWLTTAIETEGSPEELQRAIERVGAPVPNPYVAGHVTLKAICVDLASGQILHNLTLFETDEPVVLNTVNSYASPTPVAEAGRVYCDFGAMGTACVDAATGSILWSRHLPIIHQVGPGSSPILYDDTLILTRDGCDQQYVIALDKATGRAVWKTPRPPHDTSVMVYRKAFTTPVVFDNDGTEQMVVVGAQWIVSYDPDNGEERWRVDTGPTFSNASCPVYGDGMVYACTAFGGTRMLAIRTDGRGDVTDTHVAWELQRSTPRRTSPLLVGDRLYLVSERGVASCVDAQTGEVHWSQRLDGAYSASPTYAGGRVYFFGENGTTTVVQPGDSFRSLAENHVSGRIMATPAFVTRSIILRTDTHLYRIEQRVARRDG
jgi:outer membrane protein assembly factor BamB